jgi:dCMP deaminase
MTDWDIRFIEMAAMVASWSKDPSTKCGAVVVRPDKSVCSVGFNGFAKGCSDADDLYANRELKYERVVHAEVNSILLAREPLTGYTMYTYPPNFGPSCARCSSHIIQAGITRVVHVLDTSADFAQRWKETIEIGLDMYAEAGVEIVSIPIETLAISGQTGHLISVGG